MVFHKINLTHIFTIIAENTDNSPNSSSYTIEHKIVRKYLTYCLQNWHFLKCHSNCSINKVLNCSYAKSSKQQLTASYICCEGRHGKVLQTRILLFKCTIVFTGVKKVNWHYHTKYKTNKFYTIY